MVGKRVLGNFSKHFEADVRTQDTADSGPVNVIINKQQDPFYYSVDTGNNKQKKKKKTKKYRVPGVSEHDNKVLASVRSRAWYLDMAMFHCCGFRFGWSALLGLIPL